MNIKEIIKKHLEDNGFDGLVNDSGCGCMLDDFMPCKGGWYLAQGVDEPGL